MPKTPARPQAVGTPKWASLYLVVLTIQLVVTYLYGVMKLPKVKKDRGYYMRIFRATYGLNRAEAAALFGLNPSFWSLMEAGKRNASPVTAAQLAKTIGAPLELFLGIEVTR